METQTKHYIYLYTNLINGHQYVGQTNNIERRKREHHCDISAPSRSSYHSLLARAMRKYGENNFSFEILNENLTQEEANLLEEYWEVHLNTKAPNGYNIKDGGKEASITHFSKEEIGQIKQSLKNGQTYEAIGNQWNISQGYISAINHGKFFSEDGETYPLQKKQLTKDDAPIQEAVRLLKETNLTLDQIATKVGMCKASITHINNGSYHYGASDVYPIRLSKAEKNKRAAKLLATTELSYQAIGEKVGLSASTIGNINNGTYRKYKEYNYPIRKRL